MYAQCRTNDPPTFKHCSRILRGMTLLSLLTVLGLMNTPAAIAAEPTIYIPSGETPSPHFSLGLRNDGVLFQFGGQQFTPATLDGSVATPTQPDAVILTGIASLLMDDNKGGSQQEGSSPVFAMTSTSEVYTWQPNGTLNTQPVVIETSPGNPLTGIKEVVTGGPTTLIVTQSGTVFSFDSNAQTTQLTDLSGVKTIITDWMGYYALTNSGNVLFGQWDGKNSQYLTPITIKDISPTDISNVAVIDVSSDGKYSALTDAGEIYIWAVDFPNNIPTPTPATKVKDTSDVVLSNIVQMIVGNTSGIALTGNDDIYTWGWSSDANGYLIPDLATLITGVSNITKLYQQGYNGNYLAVTSTGDLYELTNPAAQITGISDVKAVYSSMQGDWVALTNGGDVYTWLNNYTPGQLTDLPKIDRIEMFDENNGLFLALTTDGNIYEGQGIYTTQVTSLSNISVLKEGGNHVLAMKSDGILCGWGDNSSGQLGSTPTPIQSFPPDCNIEDLIVATSAARAGVKSIYFLKNNML